jgi:hypothetical protein
MAMEDSSKLLEVSVDCMFKMLKPHTNALSVRGRPTLKDVEHFRNGSLRELYERSPIDERTLPSETFIVNHIVNYAISTSNST